MAKQITDREKIKRVGVYIGVPGLGDFLFIIPLFRALKKEFPNATVTFIGKFARDYVKPIYESSPYIDDILEYHLYEELSPADLAGFVLKLRKRKFDLIVDTQRKFAPSLLLKLGGARHMVSYSSNGVFSDFKVETPNRDQRHTTDVSLDLARAIGIRNPSMELEITPTAENIRLAERFYTSKCVGENETVIGIIPSAGHFSRCWKPEYFGEVADLLSADRKCRIMFFGTASDAPVIDECISRTSAPVIVEDYGGKTILDSAALMQRCAVIIGGDCGPMHVADAAGAPCIGVYGPTLPERFGLLGRNSKQICLYLECTPCTIHDCPERKCLDMVTPQMVFEAAKEILDGPVGGTHGQV